MNKKYPFNYLEEIIEADFTSTEISYMIDKLREYLTYKEMKKKLKDFKLKR
jgi:hypothetical protein